MILWAFLLVWIGALIWFFYIRLHLNLDRVRRRIAFRPRNTPWGDQLFTSLLSGNLSVLEDDNFNQLESALPLRRARHLLRQTWCINSGESWRKEIDRRLTELGTLSASEQRQIERWREGEFGDTEGRHPLQDACTFLAIEARIVDPSAIRKTHLNPMAWDIQQIAYMVRLGLAAGFAPMGFSIHIMERLQDEARRHYDGWDDYFLSSLIGMGRRNHVDIFLPGDWHRIARSYTVLVASWDDLLQYATGWNNTSAPSLATPNKREVSQRTDPLNSVRLPA